MRLNNNSANFHKSSHSKRDVPTIASKSNGLLPPASHSSKQSESAFDLSQTSLTSDTGLTQQIASLISLLKTMLESLGQSTSNSNDTSMTGPNKAGSKHHGNSNSADSDRDISQSKSHRSGSRSHANRTSGFSNQNPVNSSTNEDNTSVTGNSDTVSNSPTNLPAVNSADWSTRDGKNGEEFATPFVSKNVIKDGNSITTQLKGNEGAEATLDKKIGTGFYQFNVNPKLSSQVGDIPTVFFYSGKGSDGGDYEGGFELDAEYNMVEQGTVTFGTWIDGKKYNEVTVPAPKGDQTIGFNIQDGVSQIGFVNSDGSFEPVSETKDKRITSELASNLQAMTNTWRSKSTGGSDNGETSSITINGFGRSDEPGQPVKSV